jgi:hypothetical protein
MPKYLHLCVLALIIWTIPFLISFAFYDQNGNQIGNYWVFKSTMILVSTFTSFFVLRGFYKKFTNSNIWINSFLIVFVQIIMDIPALLLFLKMDSMTYLLTVVPIYLVMIPLVNFYIAKKIGGS